jgi:hypothetical protein
MKIILSLTLAAALALSTSFAAAQQNEDNGLSLGKSMPGSTAGVPYPNRAASTATAPVAASGAMGSGGTARHHRKHRKHHHQM